jgi:uncharacterized membrane protein HdeD (DUF308 family)
MHPLLSKKIESAVKNWWVHLLAGILYIIISIWVLSTPLASFIGLSVLFSIVMLVSGVFEIIFALSNRHVVDNWGWYLVSAIIDLMGIVLVVCPWNHNACATLACCVLVMFKGFSAAGIAIDFETLYAPPWGWLPAGGIIALLPSSHY